MKRAILAALLTAGLVFTQARGPAGSAPTATAPVAVSAAGVISMPAAGAGQSGYLTDSAGVLAVDAGVVLSGPGTTVTAPHMVANTNVGFKYTGNAGGTAFEANTGTYLCLNAGEGACFISTNGNNTTAAFAGSQFSMPQVGLGASGTGGTTVMFNTAPTITGFGGTGAAVAFNLGSVTFDVNVGTVAPGNTGTITLPASTTGWECRCRNKTTTTSVNEIIETSDTTTTCAIAQVVIATGSAANFNASDHLRCIAFPL